MSEFQADAEDVLIPTSDRMVNTVAEFRAVVDEMLHRTEEASTTVMIGDFGNACVAKMGEFHTAAINFLEEVERTASGVGTVGQMSTEQEATNAQTATSTDVSLT